MRRRARQAGGHEHRLGVYGKMHQRAALEFEDWLARVSVLLVLLACILNLLARERVLQLHRGHGDAVQAQCDIEGLLRASWREVELTSQSQAIRGG